MLFIDCGVSAKTVYRGVSKEAPMRRFLFVAAIGTALAGPVRAQTTLMNASYDATRELYAEINKAFSAAWQKTSGKSLQIRASHAGSGSQARSVIDGLQADVVTLALRPDIDAIAERSGRLAADWPAKMPNGGVPYTSTILFVVRQGNPKGIHDWADLIKPGVSIVTPNPKTSGGARWNYLAAWGYALHANGGDTAKARAFVAELFRHTPVLDSGARGATISFVRRKQGDVLLAWEDDAVLATKEFRPGALEIVVPSISIKAEPVVAVVDQVVDRRGTRAPAEAYLKFLYSPEGQEIIARHHYRPIDPAVAAKHEGEFPKLELFDIELFGGWKKAAAEHFADGGTFDQITQP
jgi:sulfate/thiosulfate-binding protein